MIVNPNCLGFPSRKTCLRHSERSEESASIIFSKFYEQTDSETSSE